MIAAQRKHTWKKFSEKHFLGERNLNLIVLISLLPQSTQLDVKPGLLALYRRNFKSEGRVGRGGQLDQNTLYRALKEFIKVNT